MEFLNKLYENVLNFVFENDKIETNKSSLIVNDKCTLCEKICNLKCECRCHVSSCLKCDKKLCDFKNCKCGCHRYQANKIELSSSNNENILESQNTIPTGRTEKRIVLKTTVEKLRNNTIAESIGNNLEDDNFSPFKPLLTDELKLYKTEPDNIPSNKFIKKRTITADSIPMNELICAPEENESIILPMSNVYDPPEEKKGHERIMSFSNVPLNENKVKVPLIKFKSKTKKKKGEVSVISNNSSIHANNTMNKTVENVPLSSRMRNKFDKVKFKDLIISNKDNNNTFNSSMNSSVGKVLLNSSFDVNTANNHASLYHKRSSVTKKIEDLQKQIQGVKLTDKEKIAKDVAGGFEKQEAWQMYSSLVFGDINKLPDANEFQTLNAEVGEKIRKAPSKGTINSKRNKII